MFFKLRLILEFLGQQTIIQMLSQSFHPEYGKAYKYQFDIQLHTLEMEIPFPSFIQITWRRKNKSISTKQKLEVKGNQKQFKFSQKLSMISTCYYDNGMLSFKDKNSVITIIIYINNVPKSGGQISTNLTSILNPTNIKQVHSKTITCPLDKCPIKNSSLTFTLQGAYLQQMIEEPNRSISMTSDISSLYAKSFTDSNFSLNFGRELPSKDCESVKDITNMFKFQNRFDISNKKRSDSASCHGPTLNSISEQINVQSKKSIGRSNVSEVGKGQYILPPKKDDKFKQEKFRLEAENTQLKLFNQEQNKQLSEQVEQISQMKSQLAFYSEQSSKMRVEMTRLQNKLLMKESKQRDVQTRLTDMTSLQENIAQLQIQLSRLRSNYDQSKSNNQALKIESEKVNRQLFILQNQKNSCKQQLDVIQNRLKEKELLLDSNKQQFQKFYSQRNQMMKYRYQCQSKIRQYQQEILHSSLEKNKQKNINLQKMGTIKNLQHGISLLNQKLKSSETQNRNMEYRIRELQNNERIIRGNIDSLENTKNNLERQLQYASEDLYKKSQNIDMLTNFKSKNQHQIGILRKQLQEYNIRQAQVSQLKKRIEQMGDDQKSASQTLTKANESAKALKQENYKSQQQIISRVKQVESLNRYVSSLKKQSQSLRTEILRLNQRMEQEQNHIMDQQSLQHQKTADEHRRAIKLLQATVENMNSQKTAIQKNYDELLESNIQLQIRFKMLQTSQSSANNTQIQELRRQLIVEKTNVNQCQEQIGVLEKQVKEKNRALAIEIQKCRLYAEEAHTLQQTLIERNTHLDIEKEKCEVLELNIRGLQDRNDQVSKQSLQLKDKVQILQLSLQSLKKDNTSIKQYENRIKELEGRETQKIKILEQLNNNLFKSNNIIKQLNKALEIQGMQLNSKEKIVEEMKSKLISNQQLKRKNTEVFNIASQNRNLEKKNQLLMKEVCQLKQQLEVDNSQKNRQSGDTLQKIQTLQSQLSKREEKIKRLEKENTKLQEQNIQLNIKIMKELTELHKKQQGIKIEYSKSLNRVLSESQN